MGTTQQILLETTPGDWFRGLLRFQSNHFTLTFRGLRQKSPKAISKKKRALFNEKKSAFISHDMAWRANPLVFRHSLRSG